MNFNYIFELFLAKVWFSDTCFILSTLISNKDRKSKFTNLQTDTDMYFFQGKKLVLPYQEVWLTFLQNMYKMFDTKVNPLLTSF